MIHPLAANRPDGPAIRWGCLAMAILTTWSWNSAILAQSPVRESFYPSWDAPASAALGVPVVFPSESTSSNQSTMTSYGPSHESFDPIRPNIHAAIPDQASQRTYARPSRLPQPQARLVKQPTSTPPFSSSESIAAQPVSSGYYLGTHTAKATLDAAEKLFAQSEYEFRCGAFASAETFAWEVLRHAATAIDLQSETATVPTASERFRFGHEAILEAQDFVGPYALGGSVAIARLARAHRTPVIRQTLPAIADADLSNPNRVTGSLPSSNEAVDRYLDYARQNFASLATQSVMAARALDLLAAIRIGRNQPEQLPEQVAICLRRAAAQGQPTNPDLLAKLGLHLSDVGLLEEAHWALSSSLSMREDRLVRTRWQQISAVLKSSNQQQAKLPPSVLVASQIQSLQAPHPPEVVTLAPEQFAAISPSVINGANVNIGQIARASTTVPEPAPANDQEPSRRPSFLKKWW